MKVKDFDATCRFYVEGLGFTLKRNWQRSGIGGALIDTGGGCYLEISGGGEDPTAQDSIFRHLAVRVADCDAAAEQARRAGGEITIEPKDIEIPSDPPVKARIAFCKGLDGELIEFFQNDST
jgi:glyoxylase I family protein